MPTVAGAGLFSTLLLDAVDPQPVAGAELTFPIA